MTTLADYLNELTPDGLRTLFGAGLLWGIRRGSFALPVGALIGPNPHPAPHRQSCWRPRLRRGRPHHPPSLSVRRAIFRWSFRTKRQAAIEPSE